ncbi:hypothetical protein ACH46N_29015 [Streptomyces pristinaespiralis]|jgi:hypothetical protein|uniref:Uncharacterized protein n=2 Tax=Streptomyces pristinaespiralis TaxID=38300 RepID=B5HD65_STRE2|nr:hypothetical protein [Streptomyces pristinaespiralis]ALC25269.1 hypothetical protein SPRI_6963 [Streptomyces pristinaespiralis]EDY64776.1 conserved hypothetical protein [Streptomyces pristinaespiralis ATCC 25486]QMU12497.1 hypothetical protein H3L99_01970 [Streptomyces pristinaespiralis]
MNDRTTPPLQALPDGEAELRLVVRLHWEDVAALGQEAGRLAAQMQRPVSLDEAAGHRLRTRSAVHAKPASASASGSAPAGSAPHLPPPTSVSSLTARTPGEHARQAIEKINGTTGLGRDVTQTPA